MCQSDAELEFVDLGTEVGVFLFCRYVYVRYDRLEARDLAAGSGVGLQNIWNKYTVVIACVEHERESKKGRKEILRIVDLHIDRDLLELLSRLQRLSPRPP